MSRIRLDDVTYEVRARGDGDPLLLIHGFTRSAATWDTWPPRSDTDRRVIAVSLLGHGQSDSPAPARHAIERQAADLAEILARLGAAPADVLGYSLGARVALRLAIDWPGAVRRLVLESPSAGIEDAADRAARRTADQRWVEQLDDGDMEGFVRDWAAQAIFESQASLPAHVRATVDAERRANDPTGLAASLLGAGQGVMTPLHQVLARIRAATLVISGGLDTRGTARAAEVAGAIPDARHVSIGDAGHTPHLETPERFQVLVRDFLATPVAAATASTPLERSVMPVTWTTVRDYEDIHYEHSGTGIARVTIDRQHVRNAFRPQTVTEMLEAFRQIRDDASIGVAILTGAGDVAFCSGGDQSVKVRGGYQDSDGVARLNVLDLQRLIRSLPIPVIALVNGYAIGGGHVLHVICDLSIASENAVFGQTGPRVGSFDAGYGASMLARIVGHKKAREIWYLCRQYSAADALEMGLVNAVVPLAELEEEGIRWCDEILEKSPTAIRFLKRAFNADVDGLAGLQELAGDATMLYYTTDEAHEGSQAFLEKRKPDFSRFPRRP